MMQLTIYMNVMAKLYVMSQNVRYRTSLQNVIYATCDSKIDIFSCYGPNLNSTSLAFSNTLCTFYGVLISDVM